MNTDEVTTNLADTLTSAVHGWHAGTDRGQQKQIGVSDLGGCREFVRFLTVAEAFSDDPDNYAAFVGSALGAQIEQAFVAAHPKVRTGVEVLVTLPSGAAFPGHPDLVFPTGVLDIKTVDGLTAVRRSGPSMRQQFQRHLYAAGLVQAGQLPYDCWVGNAWFDRSGRDSTPHIQVESYDPSWLDRADEWLSDVQYAVYTGENASKDMPLEWCARCCEYFSKCRAEDVLSDREQGGLIEDPDLLDAVEANIEGKRLRKQADAMIEDSRRMLAQVSGRTGSHVVRWVYVNGSDIPGYYRQGYTKLDIRPIPKVR